MEGRKGVGRTQLSLATRGEDWASKGQPKGKAACVCAQSLSRVRLFATPCTVARQAPLSMGFPRQDSKKVININSVIIKY